MTRGKGKEKTTSTTGERLQKLISRCGVASRRDAEELITQGRVEVGGKIILTLGFRVDAGVDEVRVDGERIRVPERVVLLLNKPEGYLCSRDDPKHRQLVYQLLPDDSSLRSVGRLDFNTEGLLVVTNDGDLAHRLGHPKFGIQRVYEARVRGVPDVATLGRLVRGVRLEDGIARVETAVVFKTTARNAWIRLTLTEGRYREVRRLLEKVGHPVMRLRRVNYAGLGLSNLKKGQWRRLSDAEVEELEKRGHVGGFELPPDPRLTRNRLADPQSPPPAAAEARARPARAERPTTTDRRGQSGPGRPTTRGGR